MTTLTLIKNIASSNAVAKQLPEDAAMTYQVPENWKIRKERRSCNYLTVPRVQFSFEKHKASHRCSERDLLLDLCPLASTASHRPARQADTLRWHSTQQQQHTKSSSRLWYLFRSQGLLLLISLTNYACAISTHPCLRGSKANWMLTWDVRSSSKLLFTYQTNWHVTARVCGVVFPLCFADL